jgi:hypothetical protein
MLLLANCKACQWGVQNLIANGLGVMEFSQGQRIKGEVYMLLCILSSYHFYFVIIMSSDQCTCNPDGSLKDPKDIQWFNNKDDVQPLSSTSASAKPLG